MIAWTVLGLHGYLWLVVWPALSARSAPLAAVVSVVAALPWIALHRWMERRTLATWLGYGVVPFVWVTASAVLELDARRTTGAMDAMRATVGMVAHLAATSELLRRRMPHRSVDVEPFVRTSPHAVVRRARIRTVLFTALGLPLTAAIVVTPYLAAEANRFDRTFATVSGTVLGISLVLAVVPPAIRREPAPATSERVRWTTAAMAACAAVALLLVERLTR